MKADYSEGKIQPPPISGHGKHRFVKDPHRQGPEPGFWVLADKPHAPKNIPIDWIYVSPRRREVQVEKVVELAKSISVVGLQEPIKVRQLYGDDPGLGAGDVALIAGHHRLEACRSLGWTEVPAFVLYELTDRQARMIEITENLHRCELTELERKLQIKEWMDLERQERETQALSSQVVTKIGKGRPEGGIRAAARELGIDRAEADRSEKIGSMAAEAIAVAKEVGLDDNASALEVAARRPKEEQADTLRAIKAAGTVAAFKRERPKPNQPRGVEAIKLVQPMLAKSILPHRESQEVGSLSATSRPTPSLEERTVTIPAWSECDGGIANNPMVVHLRQCWKAASQQERDEFWYAREIETGSKAWKVNENDTEEVRELKHKLDDAAFKFKRLKTQKQSADAHLSRLIDEVRSKTNECRRLADQVEHLETELRQTSEADT